MQLKEELPRAVQQRVAEAKTQAKASMPHSAAEAWRQLPYLWRLQLFIDAFVFASLGFICLTNPNSALELHQWVANKFGWVGPAPSLASNSLIFYTQLVGVLCCGLACITAYCWYRADIGLARAFAFTRIIMCFCYLFATFLGHPLGIVSRGKTSTVYNFNLLLAVHAGMTAIALFASGPQFWRAILGERVPAALKA